MGRKKWLRQFESARELSELYAMQKLEPTGFRRLEIYLAKILAALVNQNSGRSYDWRKYLEGLPHQQTPEQMFAILKRLGQ